MATHSSTLAWKIHGRRSLVGCSPWGCEELEHKNGKNSAVTPSMSSMHYIDITTLQANGKILAMFVFI